MSMCNVSCPLCTSGKLGTVNFQGIMLCRSCFKAESIVFCLEVGAIDEFDELYEDRPWKFTKWYFSCLANFLETYEPAARQTHFTQPNMANEYLDSRCTLLRPKGKKAIAEVRRIIAKRRKREKAEEGDPYVEAVAELAFRVREWLVKEKHRATRKVQKLAAKVKRERRNREKEERWESLLEEISDLEAKVQEVRTLRFADEGVDPTDSLAVRRFMGRKVKKLVKLQNRLKAMKKRLPAKLRESLAA